MHARTLALIVAASLAGAGCVSNEAKPEPTPAPAAAPVAPPVASKPECPPEPSAKVKSTKSTKTKAGKKAETAKVDCEPAKAKAAPATTNTVDSKPVATAPAAAPAEAKPGEASKPRVVKSRDGTFDGEVYGNIPANSKWAKLQIGMHQSEVDRILGAPNDVRSYVTGKAFIPFYFGSDRHRYEGVYFGQGSVSYTGGGMGGGQGVLMMINYDPQIK